MYLNEWVIHEIRNNTSTIFQIFFPTVVKCNSSSCGKNPWVLHSLHYMESYSLDKGNPIVSFEGRRCLLWTRDEVRTKEILICGCRWNESTLLVSTGFCWNLHTYRRWLLCLNVSTGFVKFNPHGSHEYSGSRRRWCSRSIDVTDHVVDVNVHTEHKVLSPGEKTHLQNKIWEQDPPFLSRAVSHRRSSRKSSNLTMVMFVLKEVFFHQNRIVLFIMNQENESNRQDLYMSVGVMKD